MVLNLQFFDHFISFLAVLGMNPFATLALLNLVVLVVVCIWLNKKKR